MIRAAMKEKLEKIFGMPATFDAPSDAFEQGKLFIEIATGRENAGSGRVTGEYEGSLVIFTKTEALPYGFFGKRIAEADSSLTKDFFFSGLDTNNLTSPARYVNLTERRASFKFLFRETWNAAQGRLTDVDFKTNIGG